MLKLKTGLAVLALLLCMAPLSPAADYFHHTDYITLRNTGEAVSGASVYIYTPNTTTAAHQRERPVRVLHPRRPVRRCDLAHRLGHQRHAR